MQLLDMQSLFNRVFSEEVALRMCINTGGLSRHKAKQSRQSFPATLSFTKVFLKNTNDYLA